MASPAGDIPDTQAYVPFSPPSGGYTVKVPEGWARTQGSGKVSFTDKLNTVAVETLPAPVAPTSASARSTEVPALQRTEPNFSLGSISTVQRPAGSALLITYKSDSAADPVTGKVVRDSVERYEFWKAGTEAVLTLSGPVGADNVDPWRTITNSFSWG